MKITYYSPPLSVTSHKWHSSYTASLWHSWIPCLYFCTISQYPRTAVYYHRLRSLACLPLYLYPFHYPETFPASSPSPLPLSKSDWWFKQQPSAVRYSLSPPPRASWKGWNIGGIYQKCADSALSVVAFFIIHRATLLSCLSRQLNIRQLLGVWSSDNNVHGRKCDWPRMLFCLCHMLT